jgi:hypothetical protein
MFREKRDPDDRIFRKNNEGEILGLICKHPILELVERATPPHILHKKLFIPGVPAARIELASGADRTKTISGGICFRACVRDWPQDQGRPRGCYLVDCPHWHLEGDDRSYFNETNRNNFAGLKAWLSTSEIKKVLRPALNLKKYLNM